MSNYTHEKTKLFTGIPNDISLLLEKAKCFIAGGSVTSVFSGKEINDIDVYFRDYKSLIWVLSNLFNIDNDDVDELLDISSFSMIYTNHTKKSILFTKDSLNLQLIYFKFFNSAEEIFDTYDFTINMGAYDCAENKFVLHEKFLHNVAQRRLIVNPKTSFPIISLLRIDKYKQRGYSISRKDFVNLCLSVNRLKLNSWEELADAIGGMYGYVYTDLFDVKKEYSIDEAINQLMILESNMDSVACVKSLSFEELVERVNVNLNVIPESATRFFYKKVRKTLEPGVFSSYYHPAFKYSIGQIVNGGMNGVWGYKTIKGAKNHNASYGVAKNEEAIIKIESHVDCVIERQTNTYNIKGNVNVIEEVKE
jgi:hypothetical protein